MSGTARKRYFGRRPVALAIIGACGLWQAPAVGIPSPSRQAVEKGALTLTHVANSGVLVESGGTKVLIDALFDKPNPEYRAPAPAALDKMLKSGAPFD